MIPITSLADAEAAPKAAQDQRFRLREFLRVDDAKITDGERLLVERLKSAATAEIYDRLLATSDINLMFCRGVIWFGQGPG